MVRPPLLPAHFAVLFVLATELQVILGSLAWAKLQSLCVPQSAYINVPPLVDHTYGYNAPGADGTACQCNVAAYNLMVSLPFSSSLGLAPSLTLHDRPHAAGQSFNYVTISHTFTQ